jgi:hypothetical protein
VRREQASSDGAAFADGAMVAATEMRVAKMRAGKLIFERLIFAGTG